MQLTPQEIKMVERLRKQERHWSGLRWGILAVGLLAVGNLALGSKILFSLTAAPNTEPISPGTVLLIAVLFPKMLVAFALASWAFWKVYIDWHGNANRMLLLRLIDAQQEPTTINTVATPGGGDLGV